MSQSMLAVHPHAVKHGRFVAATAEQQSTLECQIGRNLYMRGREFERVRYGRHYRRSGWPQSARAPTTTGAA